MKIVWSEFAINCFKDIIEYYSIKASKKIAGKIRTDILKSVKKLEKYPESGQTEFFLTKLRMKHRYALAGNFKVIYRIQENQIIINDVFDTRQNPVNIGDSKRNE